MKYSWHLDNFDWGVFGFKVGKITDIDSSGSPEVLTNRIKSLIKELIKNRVSYATYRVSSNNFPVVHALERAGFLLVDGLINLAIDIPSVDSEVSPEIREARRGDLQELKKLTSGLYSFSRIDNDPIIPKNKANEFYVRWIENSILGKASDLVLVWEEDRKILGYITLQKKGQIPLLGVSKEARGKGISKKLIRTSFSKFKDWGLGSVTIETQMGNVPALRVYQDCGFKVVNSFLTFRWAKND